LHKSSWEEMGRALRKHAADLWDHPARVLDVGARAVNVNYPHTYREHMPPSWAYLGCDTAPGNNVDFVQAEHYRIQDAPGEYDIVLCGQVLEHVPYPVRLIGEMLRVLKPGGLLFVTAPWSWEIHRYPIDCLRILPDALKTWFTDFGLDTRGAYTAENDTWGIARKPHNQQEAKPMEHTFEPVPRPELAARDQIRILDCDHTFTQSAIVSTPRGWYMVTLAVVEDTAMLWHCPATHCPFCGCSLGDDSPTRAFVDKPENVFIADALRNLGILTDATGESIAGRTA